MNGILLEDFRYNLDLKLLPPLHFLYRSVDVAIKCSLGLPIKGCSIHDGYAMLIHLMSPPLRNGEQHAVDELGPLLESSCFYRPCLGKHVQQGRCFWLVVSGLLPPCWREVFFSQARIHIKPALDLQPMSMAVIWAAVTLTWWSAQGEIQLAKCENRSLQNHGGKRGEGFPCFFLGGRGVDVDRSRQFRIPTCSNIN